MRIIHLWCLWVFNNIGWYYYRQLTDDKVRLHKRSFEKFVEQKVLVILDEKICTGSTWNWNNKNLTLTLRQRHLANYKQWDFLKSLSVFWWLILGCLSPDHTNSASTLRTVLDLPITWSQQKSHVNFLVLKATITKSKCKERQFGFYLQRPQVGLPLCFVRLQFYHICFQVVKSQSLVNINIRLAFLFKD